MNGAPTMFGKKKTIVRPDLPAWPFVVDWLVGLEALAWESDPELLVVGDGLTAIIATIPFDVKPDTRDHIENSPARFGFAVKTGDSPTGMFGAGPDYETARDEALGRLVILATMALGEDGLTQLMAAKENEYLDLVAYGTWLLAHDPAAVPDPEEIRAIRQSL
ncbi:hypothetical protein [Herbiconiux solani]|uniref:hypothetical protein n=1 Tax=Herbiconiux solani TaxID=661329 RepID=UPI0012EDFB79|nr:hypothetical protein [Herbiconiux solani]